MAFDHDIASDGLQRDPTKPSSCRTSSTAFMSFNMPPASESLLETSQSPLCSKAIGMVLIFLQALALHRVISALRLTYCTAFFKHMDSCVALTGLIQAATAALAHHYQIKGFVAVIWRRSRKVEGGALYKFPCLLFITCRPAWNYSFLRENNMFRGLVAPLMDGSLLLW